MFAWLKRAPKREIFEYHDGNSKLAIDPLLALRSLHAAEGFDDEIDLIDKDDAFGRAAYEKCLAVVRKVFNLAPLSADGSGLTEMETWGVFNQFSDFLSSLKKKQPT